MGLLHLKLKQKQKHFQNAICVTEGRVDNTGAGRRQPGLLPESASSSHQCLRRDAGVDETQGNGETGGAGSRRKGIRETGRWGGGSGGWRAAGQEEQHAGKAPHTKGCHRRTAEEPAAGLKKPFSYRISIKKKKSSSAGLPHLQP